MSRRRIIIMIIIISLFAISIILSLHYYNGKYIVSFESGSEDLILNQYVIKNGKVKQPLTPKKEGYVFIEWQLNGQKYDFNTQVKENLNLTAKWLKEEYITITYNTLSNDKIPEEKILKGSYIDKLPVIDKENYNFIGWKLNGNLYDNELLYSDTELVACYEKIVIPPTFNVGDRVVIVGSYSESAFSTNAYHSKAIGWERVILRIFEGSNYPYMVGERTGVNGFFNESSMK